MIQLDLFKNDELELILDKLLKIKNTHESMRRKFFAEFSEEKKKIMGEIHQLTEMVQNRQSKAM